MTEEAIRRTNKTYAYEVSITMKRANNNYTIETDEIDNKVNTIASDFAGTQGSSLLINTKRFGFH